MIFFDQSIGKNNLFSIPIISLSQSFVCSDKIVLAIASIELLLFIFKLGQNYVIILFKIIS